MRSLLAVLLAAVVLPACSTAHGRAVERAAAAAASGDLVAAALAWKEACHLEPADCPRAAAARREAVAAAAALAAPDCSAGETGACVEALRPARALAPDEPVLVGLAEEAAQLLRARCGGGASLQARACAERWQGALAAPANDRALAAWRTTLAADFRQRAAGLDGPAADALLLGAAACLAGDGSDHEAAAAAASAFDRTIARKLAVTWRVEAVPPQLRCESLVVNLPVRCAMGGLVLQVEGRLDEPEHQRASAVVPVEWIAGTRHVPNPAYDAAANRVLLLEDALRHAEEELVVARSECEGAERAWRDAGSCLSCPARNWRETACDVRRDYESITRDRSFELSNARSALHATPPHLEEEVRMHGSVEQLHHRWSARWTVRLALGERQRATSGTAVHEDVEHPAFRPAALAADPLELPPHDLGAAELAAATTAAARALVGEALAAQAAAREEACPLPVRYEAGWLRCRAEVERLRGLSVDDGSWLAEAAGGAIRCTAPSAPPP